MAQSVVLRTQVLPGRRVEVETNGAFVEGASGAAEQAAWRHPVQEDYHPEV